MSEPGRRGGPALRLRRSRGLLLFPRADTPGCTTEACSFRDDWDAYEDRGVAVLGVSDGAAETVYEGVDPKGHAEEILADLD